MSGRLRVKTTAVTPTDLTVGAPTITLTKGLQEIPPVDAWEAIRECAEADPEMPPEGAIQQLGVLLNAMRENLELLRANPTIALTGFVPSTAAPAAPGVPDDAFNPAAFFPWSYGIRYNRRNVSQATSSGGGTYILETPDGASGNFLVVGELSADEVIPWGDVRRITFHGRGANGVDYSELLRSDGLDGNDVIIGIRRVEPDGSVDVVGFVTTGDVLALAGNTFQIPVVRATGFDSGQIDDVLPVHDEDYDVWLVIPDISRYDSLGNNAHLTPRVSGHFWRLIDVNLAAELMALGDTDPWHAAAVLEANAATPGANFRGDIVTLYRADFQSNRAWDPVTGEWVVFTAFFGGTLIADNGIIASHIAAGAIVAEKIHVGAVNAAKILDDAITTAKILAGAVGATELASLSVDASKLLNDAVTEPKIKAGAITGPKILDDAITAAKILAGAVGATELSALSVGTSKILDDAITTAKILAGAVSSGKIPTGAILAQHIIANAIISSKIQAGAIIAGKIATGAIAAYHVAAGAITAGKIKAGAITAIKIAAGVLPTNFSDLEGQIGKADIAAGAIIADKIAANAVSAAKITTGAITAIKIAAGVLPTNFSDLEGVIGTADIATGAIIADRIAANAVIAGKIATGAITAIKIQASTITADKLAFDLITGDTLIADNAFITKLIANVRNVDVLFESSSGVGTGRRDADTSITEFSLTKSINGMTLIQGIARDSVYEPWAVPVSKLPNGTGTSRPSGYAHVQMSGQSDVYMWKSSDGRKVYMQLPGRGDRSLIFDIIGITNPTGESGSSTGGGGGGGTTITTDTDSIYRLGTSAPAKPTGGTSTQTHTPTGWSRTEPSPTATENVYRAQRTRTSTDGTFTSATAWGSVVKIVDKAAGATTRTDSIWERGSSTPSTPSGGTNDEFHQPGGWNRTNPGPTTILNVYRSDRTIHLLNGAFQRASVWGTPVKVTDKTGGVGGGVITTTNIDYVYKRGSATRPQKPAGGTTTEEHDPSGWNRSLSTHSPYTAPGSDNLQWVSHRTRTYVGGVFTSATAWSTPVIWWRVDHVFKIAPSKPATPTGGTTSVTYTPSGWSRTRPSQDSVDSQYPNDSWYSPRTVGYSKITGNFSSAQAWRTPIRDRVSVEEQVG